MPYVKCPDCRQRVFGVSAESWVSDECPICSTPLRGATRTFSVEPGARTIRRELPATPASVANARHAMSGFREELGEDLHGTVVLLISELVTNSVIHSNAPAGTIELVACVSSSVVRVEVRDEGAGFDAPTPHPQRTHGGHGLKLVEALADRWARPAGNGTRVRFEIERGAHAERRDVAADADSKHAS